MKTKKVISLGCLAAFLILALLVGMAWMTGNIRPMTEKEKQALEEQIKSNHPAPSTPPPKTWPIGLPRTGPELPNAWSYAVDRLESDPESWFLEDAKYRIDDPQAARQALQNTLGYLSLDEMPAWKDAVDSIAEQSKLDYRKTLRDKAHCEKITALVAQRFLPPLVLVKGNASYQAVLVDYGILPGKVSYLDGKNAGWRVDLGVHQDPVPNHWNAWKSQEVATAFLQWIAAYPDAQFFVLRFTDVRFGRPRHGYYTWRRRSKLPSILTYMQPDDLGEMHDIFDPKSSENEPRYLTSKFPPPTKEVSENDLAAAAVGKLDLNELLFDFNPFVVRPPKPALTDAEREAIVKELLEKGADALRKLRDGK